VKDVLQELLNGLFVQLKKKARQKLLDVKISTFGEKGGEVTTREIKEPISSSPIPNPSALVNEKKSQFMLPALARM
jgi:hypothetical protein